MALTRGTRLGVGQITAQIGAGGMGEVYRATDTNLKRSVAIKVLPSLVSNDVNRLVRFQREAEILAALNHPHIAQVYGLERSTPITALVMELVEGSTLAERIGRGALPPEEALAIAKQIADALVAAHARGIVHRDLKPANIKVREDGTAKVLDFGLAKATDLSLGASDSSATAMTQPGVVLGTAAYMSPEQASGKAVDARSDIFSFGAVLYEMLSGRPAFSGETAVAVIASILRDDPPPITSDHTLAQIVRRCLAKSPADRFQAMSDVVGSLAGAARGERAPAIAVLPFANMSDEKEQEYFSDGLAEDIINALVQIPGLK